MGFRDPRPEMEPPLCLPRCGILNKSLGFSVLMGQSRMTNIPIVRVKEHKQSKHPTYRVVSLCSPFYSFHCIAQYSVSFRSLSSAYKVTPYKADVNDAETIPEPLFLARGRSCICLCVVILEGEDGCRILLQCHLSNNNLWNHFQ